ncbi:IclR family transcriptional regulator [Castellaniella sp.]|uniref:IclR family transcriptional regulator n=1 Tax=Castellaniella sp. TaxID=1955812 RepID=UPI003A8CCF4D
MVEKLAAPAVGRAAAILDLISKAGSPQSLADLTHALNLPKSSLHGLCATLEQLNLLTRLDSGQVTLGPHVMLWANAFLAHVNITQEFFASWDDMRVLPEETITLSVRDGGEVVYIACRNGSRPLGYTFRTGLRIPAVYTATGLAMLSTLPNESVRKLLDNTDWPTPLTAKGLRSMDDLLPELQEVRRRGYSIDREAVREGMYCFGASVFDSHNPEAIAGVAVSILANEVDPALEEHAGQAMRKLADRLSERLGGLTNSRNAWHRQAQPTNLASGKKTKA